jgi:hypothetical protein
MKTLLLIICIATISCNQKKDKTNKLSQLDSIFNSENFDTAKVYSEPCCLQYKGRPLLTIGQNVNQLDSSLSFRTDPNGTYYKHSNIITDYLSVDDFYSTKVSTGSIDGILFFSADKKGRIFSLSCSWTLNAELVDTSGMETIHILNKFFPCLPSDFKGKRVFELAHKDFIEKFKLNPSLDSADADHRYKSKWSLEYSVKLTRKNGV